MKFELSNSFDENLALFRAEAEKLDPECARILFENIAILCRDGDASRDRAVITEFHRAILSALEGLSDSVKGA